MAEAEPVGCDRLTREVTDELGVLPDTERPQGVSPWDRTGLDTRLRSEVPTFDVPYLIGVDGAEPDLDHSH